MLASVRVKGRDIISGFGWFQWLGVVGIGLVIGLLLVIVINTRPHNAGASEAKQVAAKVSRHVMLPTDETPALATVTDPSKLGNNKFLSQAAKGDKILIYAKWQQAVLYRPSVDKVVDIGPVDVAPPGGDTTRLNPLN
jgi:hypothetical protein